MNTEKKFYIRIGDKRISSQSACREAMKNFIDDGASYFPLYYGKKQDAFFTKSGTQIPTETVFELLGETVEFMTDECGSEDLREYSTAPRFYDDALARVKKALVKAKQTV